MVATMHPASSTADGGILNNTRLRTVLSYTLLLLLALSFLYPFVLAVTTSFKPLPEINENPVALLPQTWTLDGYQAMSNFNVGRWAINSGVVATLVTISNVIFAGMAGYALSRIKFPGSRALFLVILGTMMIPGIVQLIPHVYRAQATGHDRRLQWPNCAQNGDDIWRLLDETVL